MVLLQSVQVDVEEEGPARLEAIDLLADEHPVRAQDDDLLPLLDLRHELADSRIDRRFAPADRDDRRPALVDRGEALVDGELLLDRRFVFPDARSQPVQVKLQACSGLSIRTIGNFARASRFRAT